MVGCQDEVTKVKAVPFIQLQVMQIGKNIVAVVGFTVIDLFEELQLNRRPNLGYLVLVSAQEIYPGPIRFALHAIFIQGDIGLELQVELIFKAKLVELAEGLQDVTKLQLEGTFIASRNASKGEPADK